MNVKIYIPLLEEGTFVARPTQAEKINDDTYKVLPTSNYNPESEIWEFPPGSIVRCKKHMDPILGEQLLAYDTIG